MGKPQHGEAQRQSIDKVRREVDANGASCFKDKDWTNIGAQHSRNACLNNANLKLLATNFYIKGIAVWVPHLVVPNHIPTCPKCEDNTFVDVSNSSWVANPKTLYGVRSHRCLDTYLHKCKAIVNGKECGSFTGYNDRYLAIDNQHIVGIFNFYVSKGHAIDEELYSLIANSSQDTTASIYKRVAACVTDKFLDDALFYCSAASAKKVRDKDDTVVPGSGGQKTIDGFLQKVGPTTDQQRKRRKLLALDRELRNKEMEREADISFLSVFKKKENRNSTGLPFKYLGKAKCLKLIEKGTFTAKELLAHQEEGDSEILASWKAIVRNHYDNLDIEVEAIKNRKRAFEKENGLTSDGEAIDVTGEGDGGGGQPPDPPSEEDEDEQEGPEVNPAPPFSKMMDPTQYNARVMSKSSIDRVVATNFQHRKAMQVSKMRNILFHVLKIDFHCKLPPKFKVHTGRGKSFAPFQTGVTIQNEDARTVFWKCCPCSESIEMIRGDLELMKKRADKLGCDVRVVCVDNCCTTRGKTTETFPGCLVKLDIFHWVSRWDDILFDKKNEKALIFFGMLRTVLFVVERPECERVKFHLSRKLRRQPTNREILKEAKGTVPPKEQLKERMDALLRFVHFNDSAMDLQDATVMIGPLPKPNRFFKPRAQEVNRLTYNQMEHVVNDCTSDPHSSVARTHRANPRTNKAFSGRSTGTNEVDHRQLNRLLNTPSIGLMRGERVMWDYYDESNERKLETRMGQEPTLTTHSEKLYYLSSRHKAIGFKEDDLPVKGNYPPELDFEEYIGVSYDLPDRFKDEDAAANEEEEVREQEESADVADADLANFLAGVDFEDEESDINVGAEQFHDNNNNDDDDDEDDVAEPVEVDVDPFPVANEDVQRKVEVLLPKTIEKETALQAFTRLTKEQPWVPLRSPGEEKNEVDVAEEELFNQLEEQHKFNRKAGISSRRGHKRFAEQWDIEVANRFKSKFESSDETVILINRKTYLQLQKHYDERQASRERARLVAPNDPLRQNLERSLRDSRRSMPVTQVPQVAEAIRHNPQLGVAPLGRPTTLNTNILAQGVTHNPQRNVNTPFLFPVRRPLPAGNTLGGSFKRNKHCWRCGFQKRDHIRTGNPLGEQCKNNCSREECSKCLQRLEPHSDGKYGPYCSKEPNPSSKHSDWCKQTNNN